MSNVDLQRVCAAILLLIGLALVAGVGWAAIVAGAVLLVVPTQATVRSAVRRVSAALRRMWTWLLADRQRVAAASMPVALLLLGVGVGVAVSTGWGLAVTGTAVGALSIRADAAG